MSRPAVCSFSGGKDSCLALWRAQQQGVDVRSLLVMLEESGERSRSHAIPPSLLERQAQALRLTLVTRNASWRRYEEVFIAALRELRASGHEIAIFGDIDLQAHRDWEEHACTAAGLTALLPLWRQDRHAIAQAIIDEDFRAVVVCVDTSRLSEEFCGREYDAAFIDALPANVDVCGENGEFHTFVYDGPNFAIPVAHEIRGFQDIVTPAEFGTIRYRYAQL